MFLVSLFVFGAGGITLVITVLFMTCCLKRFIVIPFLSALLIIGGGRVWQKWGDIGLS